MSVSKRKLHVHVGKKPTLRSTDVLESSFSDILNGGIHALCFSPYEEGQEPGDIITEKQIRRRMEIISPYVSWIRSFSCTEGNELIPKIAKEYGLKTLVGAWLGDDDKINQQEMKGLYDLCDQGLVDIAAIGNEVMYRGDLSESELIEFMLAFKSKFPKVQMGYVDAYYEFVNRNRITELCDVILANCYPFWEGCPIEYSLAYMKEMYRLASSVANGKKVIISETGWPNKGTSFEGAHPSHDNALSYFVKAQQWASSENIDMFYFSSFDESWKIGSEGDVGAYWGLWDKNEKLKF